MSGEDRTGFDALVEQARTASFRAYAPYSSFSVGCALQCRGGEIFVGCNVENASFGLSLCAERVAVTSAVASGRRDFVAVAVYAEGPECPTPCGACRQFLAEFSPDMTVVVSNGHEWRSFPLRELLPAPFTGRHLPR